MNEEIKKKIVEEIKKEVVEKIKKEIVEEIKEEIKKTEIMPSKKEIPIKQFVLNKQPQNKVEEVLIISYYLKTFRNIPFFNIKDLENAFIEAGIKLPKNMNYKIIRNIEKDFMMEVKEKKNGLKAWTITAKGEEYVEKLPRENS